MSNPYMVQIPFCNTGNKNAIQLTQQAGQDPEDATYQVGFPPVTMLNEDAGGLPPKGLDFNGIFYELSSPIAHYCRGDRIQFDATYAAAIGGYAKGWVVASNDYQKDYISLVDNNLADPNGTNTTWSVYAGQGSVPVATSTTTGTVKLVNSLASAETNAALTAAQGKALQDEKVAKTDIVNNLNSTDTQKPLSAAQGKVLNDQALGVGQTWQNVTGSRTWGATYTNNTGKPIVVSVTADGGTNCYVKITTGSLVLAHNRNTYSSGGPSVCATAVIPHGTSYRVEYSGNSITWAELR